MPAFGCNPITIAFAQRVLNEPIKGFRLSDRIVSALDRFIGALSRFRETGKGIMARFGFIYPFVGATDWTHSLNLADAPNAGYAAGGPLGATGNFQKHRITWSGNVVHNDFGVTTPTGAYGNTNIDCADALNFVSFWNRKSWGIYSRTNSAGNIRDVSASFTEPKNGYTYFQGMILRYSDGNYYGDLCRYYKSGVPEAGNRVAVGVTDSLGLFIDNQRGPGASPTHYAYKRSAYIGGEDSTEIGMGYGDVGSNAWLTFGNSGRNYAFFFSTVHTKTFQYPGLPGTPAEFEYFVQQLQVALLRSV